MSPQGEQRMLWELAKIRERVGCVLLILVLPFLLALGAGVLFLMGLGSMVGR